jgi:hypothetical protein
MRMNKVTSNIDVHSLSPLSTYKHPVSKSGIVDVSTESLWEVLPGRTPRRRTMHHRILLLIEQKYRDLSSYSMINMNIGLPGITAEENNSPTWLAEGTEDLTVAG